MSLPPENLEDKASSNTSIEGKLGTLTTRLANNTKEITQAQHIRYQVFCEEMSAVKSSQRLATKRDEDAHDSVCDHLLVIDQKLNQEKIVGTQRFFVKSAKDNQSQFYSQSEFDLEGLAFRYEDKNFMELGRSCILPEYRSKRTMELMWHGTWAYAIHHNVDVMVGCASFEAQSIDEISPALGFLAEHALCPPEWDTPAIAENAISIKDFKTEEQNIKKGLAKLPPLIKGYLRLGAKFASYAVPDADFGTIDIMVILPVETINQRYVNFYGADAGRYKS